MDTAGVAQGSAIAGFVRRLMEDEPERAEGIRIVYLFGSRANGEARTRSDVDLAFLLDEDRYRREPFATGGAAHFIGARLALLLNLEVDVTLLNGASLEMRYQIVTTGRCIYAKDSDQRWEYEALVRSMYFDFKPFLDHLRRIRSGNPAVGGAL